MTNHNPIAANEVLIMQDAGMVLILTDIYGDDPEGDPEVNHAIASPLPSLN